MAKQEGFVCMKKSVLLILLALLFINLSISSSFAQSQNSPKTGKVTGKSVVAGVLSLIIWPGIGQAVNDNKGEKCITHAVIGILPPYRFWSGYDALMNRKGGYWQGRI
jgi:hypothetical protein